MNFTEALAAMERGEKVKRKGIDEYSYKENKKIYIVCNNGKAYEAHSINTGAILSDDWEIYNPKPVLNPCHCGKGEGVFCEEEVDGEVMFYAQCSGCGMRTGYTYDEEDAARIWNDAHPLKENNKTITNYEALFLPFLRDTSSLSICRFIRDNVFERAEECGSIPCKECSQRFATWLQEEYKEDKQ